MMRERIIFYSTMLCVIVMSVACMRCISQEGNCMVPCIQSVKEACALFPKTPQEIYSGSDNLIKCIDKKIDEICAIDAKKRTYDNTVRTYDEVGAIVGSWYHIVYSVTLTNPHKKMRDAANKDVLRLQAWSVERLGDNIDLYHAVKEYFDGPYQSEKDQLSEEERYLLRDTMRAYKKKGFDLPKDERDEIKNLKKEIAQVGLEFSNNIANDKRTITVTKQDLAGTDSDFIESLQKTDDGNYILGVDYPTYKAVMEHCTVEKTRKALWQQFSKRGYPKNCSVLGKLIELQDALAKKLGFTSYAQLSLDSTMAESPEVVGEFLIKLLEDVEPKVQQEVAFIKSHMPDDVSLNKDGALDRWNAGYVRNYITKHEFAIDERKVSEYFPVKPIVDAILDIYQDFLGLRFSRVENVDVWHEDVFCIEVSDLCENRLGFLFLDLFPRDNKYSHACQMGIVSAHKEDDGVSCPAVGLVIANFPKARAGKPALLMRSDVTTFFHEFGHAMHDILGATKMYSCSGTGVKFDFVETPSQMFEQWMSDRDMLRKVSGHYKTGEKLSDDMLDKFQQARLFGKGVFAKTQAIYSQLALAYFAEGKDKDVHAMKNKYLGKMSDYCSVADEDYFECSWGHLAGYGPKYYCYLWSLVYALDIFDEIKKAGLQDKVMGQRIRKEVLGRGGSVHAAKLLEDFLGREPSNKAFLAYLGL